MSIQSIESIRDGFAEGLSNVVTNDMSTHEEFMKMFEPGRSDYDFNPFEDYYLVYLFVKTHNIDHIVERVGRSKSACSLRLRLFFDFPYLNPSGPPMNYEQTKKILKAFRTRAQKYSDFLEEYQLIKDFVDLMEDDEVE